MDSATLSGYLETIEDQGYCIVEDAVDEDLMRKIRNAVTRLEDENDVHQGLHSDDGLVSVRRPRIPFMVTTIWAFTDFTEENGATRIVPGSHKFDHEPRKGEKVDHVPAEMKAGSVLIVNGGTWHCGGANNTQDEWRLGVSVQYCQGYLRQQQNQYYSLRPEVVKAMPERLAALCGFTLYKGIMGHVDGESPGRFLGADSSDEIAYAAMRTKNGVAES